MILPAIIILLSILLWLLTRLSRRGDAHSHKSEHHKQHLADLRREMLLDGRLKPKPTPYGEPQGFERTPIITPPTQLEMDTTPAIAQQRTLVTTPAIIEPDKASIRALASQYKWEYDEKLDGTRYLFREIMDNGGLRPYANDYLAEEFASNIPTWYRRSTGLAPDEMAETLFYDSDTDLLEAISKAEITRQSLISQKVSFQTHLNNAKLDLLDELNPPE